MKARFIGGPVGGRGMGTAYAPNAEGSVEDIRSLHMGTAYAPSAEGYAEEGLRGLREDDAGIRLDGLREDDARIRLSGLREDDAEIRLSGLREDDAGIRLSGLREDDAGIRMDGLREDDAGIQLGAPDFHPRFPVEFRVNGSRMVSNLTNRQVSGLLDFLKSGPTGDEWIGRLQSLKSSWLPLKNRIALLPSQQRAAVFAQMTNMNADSAKYDRAVDVYLAEGGAGMTSSRVSRVERLEAALPSIEKLVSQMEVVAPAPTPAQEDTRAREVVLQDVVARDEQRGFFDRTEGKVVMYGGIAAAGITTVVLAAKAFSK